jgi:hypothetical protein
MEATGSILAILKCNPAFFQTEGLIMGIFKSAFKGKSPFLLPLSKHIWYQIEQSRGFNLLKQVHNHNSKRRTR